MLTMKPIIQGEGIIARLGDRELTREELRRLPKGVKDKVTFYPIGATPEDELNEKLRGTLAWGFIEARLDDKKISLDEYDQLSNHIQGKVTFNITDKGKKVLDMDDNKKGVFLHFDRWETTKEVAKIMEIPLKKIDDYVSELVKDGLMEEQDGMFKSKESIKFLRVQDYLKHFDKRNAPAGIIKGFTEWATKEELSEQLGISLPQINQILNEQIAKGMLEEKDEKFRVNDSDGKGKERIHNYLDVLEKSLDKQMTFDQAISSMVKGGIFDAIKKGWIEFQDDKSYTAEEWDALDDVKKDKIGVRLTERGKREIEDDNPLKIYDELAKKKNAEGGLNIIEDVESDDEGNITLKLTPEGERVKRLGEAMGISAERVFQTMLNIGLGKQLAQYMFIEDKIVEGNRRVR